MRAAGFCRRIAAAAVIPSTSGIEMSLTITSGDSRSACSTSVRPSVTCADHVELGLQQLAQQFRGFEMVVGEQQPGPGHHDVDVAQSSEARMRLAEGNYVAGRGKRTAEVRKSYLGRIRRITDQAAN